MSAVRDRYDAGLEKAKLMEEQRYVYVWRNECGRAARPDDRA